MIPVYVGYDPRESIAYHAFCQSIITRASEPCAFIPLHRPMLNDFDGQQDGTNAFIFSRYLVPYLSGYRGWAIFADGDMVCADDIAKLWRLRDEQYAVQVVKHDYTTRHPRKYIGTSLENANVSYPRKNWSSVILWNCGHPSNRILTREYVAEAGGSVLHRFQWLAEYEIGALPTDWNWLVTEYAPNPEARLYHYTLGIPSLPYYADCDHAGRYWEAVDEVNHCAR